VKRGESGECHEGSWCGCGKHRRCKVQGKATEQQLQRVANLIEIESTLVSFALV